MVSEAISSNKLAWNLQQNVKIEHEGAKSRIQLCIKCIFVYFKCMIRQTNIRFLKFEAVSVCLVPGQRVTDHVAKYRL